MNGESARLMMKPRVIKSVTKYDIDECEFKFPVRRTISIGLRSFIDQLRQESGSSKSNHLSLKFPPQQHALNTHLPKANI